MNYDGLQNACSQCVTHMPAEVTDCQQKRVFSKKVLLVIVAGQHPIVSLVNFKFKHMNIRKTRSILALWVCALSLTMLLGGCDDKDDAVPAYDPSAPIVCTSFYPTGGPIATKVILTGKNFGNSTDAISVYFNEKKAPVVGVSGDHMLVLAPRLPGDDVVIRVKIGEQEAAFDGYFDYEIQTNVTTICGGDASSTTNPSGTISLSEAQFSSSMNGCISVDKKKNIYFEIDGQSSNYLRYCANEEADQLKLIDELGIFLTVPINVYDHVHDRVYHMQANIGNNEFWYYDPDNDWVQMGKGEISWDNTEFAPGGMASWAARRTAAMCEADGKFYTRSYGGYLERYDPETGLGENLTQLYGGVGIGSTSGSTFGMVFDANDPYILYFAVDEMHCIYKLDIENKTGSVLCGGTSGYFDGPLAQAKFNSPHQMARDSEGNLYVADTENHCIRKINLKTGYVSTVAGLPQQSGYMNGTNEVAKFNKPYGLAIDSDDIIYVGDCENHAIRRVAVE